MKLLNKNIQYTIIFIVLLLIISWIYNYEEIVQYRPQSVHAWRQTDCATQVLSYAQKDFNFFKPQMHGLVSNNYTTGHSVEEMPIIFYTAASLYKIFGNHEFIYRLLNTLIFFLGLFYLYKNYSKTLKDKQWGIILSLLLFASPVFAYYGNNFISNVSAFSFTIIGWFFFFRYIENKNIKNFICTIAFFTIAALLKISELISLFTIIGLFVLEQVNIKVSEKEKLFKKRGICFILLIIPLLINLSWYLYAHWYNNIHEQKYYEFTTKYLLPFLDKEDVLRIWNRITNVWVDFYYLKWTLYLLASIFIFNIIQIRKCNRFYIVTTLILFIGSLSYLLLFFLYLHDHDYYTVCVYITTIFILITFFDLLRRHYYKIYKHWIFKILFLVFLGYNVQYVATKLDIRYNGSENTQKKNLEALYDIEPYLEKIGVKKEDKVISIPDPSPNITLYLMNRYGWTSFITDKYVRPKEWGTSISNLNEKLIEWGIKKGAKFLIITNPKLLKDIDLQKFLKNKIGQKANVSIFKLKYDFDIKK